MSLSAPVNTPSRAPAAPAPQPAPPSPLHRAAAGSRTPFSTLVAIAQAESGFDIDAKARRSSATGAFQFTEQTWLQLVKRHGAGAGHADLAALIRTDENGIASVDKADRAAVLGARRDVDLASTLAAKLCDESRHNLSRKLGRAPDEAEVRMAYFLGDGGASRLLQAAENSPDMSIRSLAPRAYANHRSMFTSSGQPMTVAQAVDALRDRYASEIARAPKTQPKFTSSTLVAAMEAAAAAKLNEIAPAAGAVASNLGDASPYFESPADQMFSSPVMAGLDGSSEFAWMPGTAAPAPVTPAPQPRLLTRAEMVTYGAQAMAPTIEYAETGAPVETPVPPARPATEEILVALADLPKPLDCDEQANGSVSCKL